MIPRIGLCLFVLVVIGSGRVRRLTMRWWTHVRDARGRRGWIDMDKVGVSVADAHG